MLSRIFGMGTLGDVVLGWDDSRWQYEGEGRRRKD